MDVASITGQVYLLYIITYINWYFETLSAINLPWATLISLIEITLLHLL